MAGTILSILMLGGALLTGGGIYAIAKKGDRKRGALMIVAGLVMFGSLLDSASIRRTALEEKIYCTTTLEGGRAVCAVLRNKELWSVERLQDLHAKISST